MIKNSILSLFRLGLLLFIPLTLATETTPSTSLPFIFFKENLKITLNEGEMQVEGDYYFRNQSNGSFNSPVFYPLLANELMPFPHHIEVKGKKFYKSSEGIYWEIVFNKPQEEQKVHVLYRQKLLASKAIYIVTSTQAWGTPLEWAEFEVNFPAAWGKLKTTYPMKVVKEEQGRKYWRFSTKHFWPKQDMIFSWSQLRGKPQ